MDIKEKEAIERQFERNLDLLVRKKFPLTATAIVAAEQPMILLFKELIHRIEKRELELDKKDKIINGLIDFYKQAEADLYEANNRINDLLDIVKQKDELIKQLCIGIREHDNLEDSICPLAEPLDCHDIKKDGTCIDCIIEYYKRGVSK